MSKTDNQSRFTFPKSLRIGALRSPRGIDWNELSNTVFHRLLLSLYNEVEPTCRKGWRKRRLKETLSSTGWTLGQQEKSWMRFFIYLAEKSVSSDYTGWNSKCLRFWAFFRFSMIIWGGPYRTNCIFCRYTQFADELVAWTYQFECDVQAWCLSRFALY